MEGTNSFGRNTCDPIRRMKILSKIMATTFALHLPKADHTLLWLLYVNSETSSAFIF